MRGWMTFSTSVALCVSGLAGHSKLLKSIWSPHPDPLPVGVSINSNVGFETAPETTGPPQPERLCD